MRLPSLERLSVRWIALAAFALCILLYLPSLRHGFIDIDDPRFIVENPLAQDLSARGVSQAFSSYTMLLYIPLTMVSYQVNAAIGGVQPFIYHLTDSLLHGANAALVAVFVFLLTRRRFPAAVTALLFAVHPLQTEAVLWASSRKDTLSAFFTLLSLITYVRYLDAHGKAQKWWSIAFYALGLFAKVAALPVVVLLFVIDAVRGRAWNKALIMEKIPYALVAVPIVFAGISGGSRALAPLGFFTMLLLGAKSTAYYLWALAWPAHLSLLHTQTQPVVFTDPLILLSVVVTAALVVGIIMSLLRNRGVLWAFGPAMFLLMLAPTFAAAQKAGLLFFASDKYAYVPSIGIFLCVALACEWLVRTRRALAVPVIATVLVVAGAFTFVTLRTIPVWQDSESLYQHVLREDPQNAVALGGMGMLRAGEDQDDEALAYYQKAIEADPHYALPYINKASVLGKLGRVGDALATYKAMIPQLTEREVRGDDTLADALLTVASRLSDAGDPDASLTLLERVTTLNPQNADAQVQLGDYLLAHNRRDEAQTAYERAVALGIPDVNPYYHLAEMYSDQNRIDDVVRVLRKAVVLDPANAMARTQLERLEKMSEAR